MTDLTMNDLLSKPTAPAVTRRKVDPRDFSKKIEVSSNTVEATINDEKGLTNEGTGLRFLESEGLNPEEWTATHFKKIEYGNPEQPMESVKFSYRRVGSPEAAMAYVMPDLSDLQAAVKKVRRSGPPKVGKLFTGRTVVGVIADVQAGKVSERGGTEELTARLASSLSAWIEYVKREKPEEIILVDAGDAIENFENTGSQERTNDLQLTEMLRYWRRMFWTWIEAAAGLAPRVIVVSVPSNHCRVRRGKAEMAAPADDYGLEVLAQVQDIAAANPKKYGHVLFAAPEKELESLAVPTVGGLLLGFAHGHQARRPEALPTWLAGQSLGRTDIGQADIVIFGHFHNLRVQTFGDDRWMFIAPTSDSGSAWFRNISGNESAPGVMTFVVEADGWRGLHVC